MEQNKKSVIESQENEAEKDIGPTPDAEEYDPREIARLMVKQAMLERARGGAGDSRSITDILNRRLEEFSAEPEGIAAAELITEPEGTAAAELKTATETEEAAETAAASSGKRKRKFRFKDKYGSGAITRIFAAPVDFHDRIQERIDAAVISFCMALVAEAHNARQRYKNLQKQLFTEIFVTMVVVCMVLLVMEANTVYEYSYNGRILGYVEAQDTVANVLDVAGHEMTANNDVEVEFKANDNVTFRKVASAQKDTDTTDQVVNKLTYMTDIEVEASGIYQDGKLKAVVQNESTANRVLSKVLQTYNTPLEGMTVKDLSYKGDVEVKPINVMLPSVSSEGAATKLLLNGGTFTLQCMTKEGDTVNSLSKTYDVTPSNINNGGEADPDKAMDAGRLVSMSKTTGAFNVVMTAGGTATEVIKYKVEEKKTDELYKGDEEVRQEGSDGRQRITGEITYINGKEVSRDIEETEVIKKPVKRIVLIGTADRPKEAPTGKFIMPITASFNYSSGFGYRWGRNHDGIDLACPTGTPVYASDGGTVTRSSVYGGYGNCIEIEHDNGTYSRYGHLSAYEVSVGDKVYQGQEIGLVGNTGWSTGSHLHFEVHPNGGAAVDPAPLIGLE